MLLALVAACGTAGEPASDPLAADDYGVTPEDVLAGVQAREEHIQRCMEDHGFEYQMRDPVDQVVFDGEQPGWGTAHDLLELVRRSHSEESDSDIEAARSRPPGYDDALRTCGDEAWRLERQRDEAVASAYETLDRAWAEFRSSNEYVEAAQAWAACMASRGYDSAWPDQVRDEYLRRVQQVVTDAGGPEHVEETAARALLDEEVALRAADDDCRGSTLTPVEQEFRRTLFAEEAETVRRIRDARRG